MVSLVKTVIDERAQYEQLNGVIVRGVGANEVIQVRQRSVA